MENSIESIWKEGFLKSDALVAPQVNNLYNQKSKHIIDKFNRMFKINLKAIVIGSFVVVVASFLVGIPIMGISMFFILNGLVLINKKLLKSLQSIDKSMSSYEYLNSFNNWMNEQIETNIKIARFMYPLIFLAMVLGFWFKNVEGKFLGEHLLNKIMTEFPDTFLIFNIPFYGILGVLLVISLLTLFGGKIYKWDFNIVYGRVFRKLNELVNDVEELRS